MVNLNKAPIQATDAQIVTMADNLVRRDIRYCVSHLVTALMATAYQEGALIDEDDAATLAMVAPGVDEYSEAAAYNDETKRATVERDADAGGAFYRWTLPDDDGDVIASGEEETELEAWRAVYEAANADQPDGREVFEHWLVTDDLARRLEAHGESVARDVQGLTIWGRSTTGQGIAMDRVIQDIARAILEA